MSKRLFLLALPLLAAPSPESPRRAVGFRLDALAWMAGSWRQETDARSNEELWLAPSGGLMLGVNRQIAGGKAVFFEFLRIEQRGEEVFYVAQPKGAPGTDFKQVEGKENEAVFENPEHDFPSRILYRKEPDGSLYAKATGGEKGKARILQYHWKPEGGK